MAAADADSQWWIAIVAYEDYAAVRRCVEAWRDQTVPPAGIVVIDNTESPDSTALRSLPVVVVSGLDADGRNTGSSGGFSAGLEQGFRRGADCVVLSDQDVIPTATMLASLREVALAHPTSVVSGVTVDPRSGEFLPNLMAHAALQSVALGLAPSRGELVGALGWKTQQKVESLQALQTHHLAGAPPVAAAPLASPHGLVIPRRVYEEVGGFRESFFVGLDDYEYCARLQRAGFDIVVALAAVAHHHLTWHRLVRVGPFSVKAFVEGPDRFCIALRNSLILAFEYSTGLRRWRWLAHEAYRSVVYLCWGPETAHERLRACMQGWRRGLRHLSAGRRLT